MDRDLEIAVHLHDEILASERLAKDASLRSRIKEARIQIELWLPEDYDLTTPLCRKPQGLT